MKKIAFASLLVLPVLLLLSYANRPNSNRVAADVPVNKFKTVSPDTPRMKQYWLVQLLRGANRTMDKATAQRIQAAHMANIDRLWKEGVVVMAGPMGYKYDNEWRGIFIMDAPDSAAAAAHIKTDSAVITGRLRFEIHPWWTETGTYVFK